LSLEQKSAAHFCGAVSGVVVKAVYFFHDEATSHFDVLNGSDFYEQPIEGTWVHVFTFF
jgi:hypothetical protein